MFAALGVGAFTAAIFHLMTHGFFKGLLFLGSGSVIHAVHEEQDMRQMGGLSKKIPITYATMLIGSLAIAGIPPLAGFFSKDEILGESFKLGFLWVWVDRLHRRRPDRVLHVPADGPDVLGRVPRPEGDLGQDPRVAAGDDDPAHPAGDPVGLPGHVPRACRSAPSRITGWLEPVFAESERILLGPAAAPFALFGIDGVLILASVDRRRRSASSSPGGCSASSRRPDPDAGPTRTRPRARAPGSRSSTARRSTSGGSTTSTTCCSWSSAAGSRTRLWWFDREVVDGTVNAIGRATIASGRGLRRVQTGRVQNYALGIAIGLIVMAGSYLVLVAR